MMISWMSNRSISCAVCLLNSKCLDLQVLLTVETDTDEASEGEEDPSEDGLIPHIQYSGGPLRPSWVVV